MVQDLVANRVYPAECTGYASDGSGVARVDGRVVFVNNMLMGESGKIRVTRVGKNSSYGEAISIDAVSPHRVKPDCPVYGRCGGCSLRHMDYTEELSLKLRRVNDCFERIGGLSIRAENILGSAQTDGYRNKTIYSIGSSGGRTVTGFYRSKTHDLISAPGCAIESGYSRNAAAALRRCMDRLGIPAFDSSHGSGIRRLMCRYGFASGEGQVVLVSGSASLPRLNAISDEIRKSCPGTVSVMLNINPSPGDTVLSRDFRTLWGRDYIEDVLCGLKFRLTPGSFYQINRNQAEKLYGIVLEYASLTGSETVLDLYCGTGTITLCLAEKSGEAIGAEIAESAVSDARQNASLNGIENVRFICADAGRAAEELSENGCRPDVIVVDPPRKGLSPEVPGIMAGMDPSRIVYVSCDPATLSRDLALFSSLGYVPGRACAVDMFPRTPHVETVVLLRRRNN